MKLNIKSTSVLILFTSILIHSQIYAQSKPQHLNPPTANVFGPILAFLSSDWMQGREAGSKGGFMAADYMASQMQVFGLEPYGDISQKHTPGYFQDFQVISNKTESASLALVQRNGSSQSSFQFTQGVDYEVNAGISSSEAETQLVFAGYGLSIADKGYDDYKGIDVKGKIVLILKGFPGHSDTTSIAWKKLGRDFEENEASTEAKLRAAKQHGALAMLIADGSGKFEPYIRAQANQNLLQLSMNTERADPEYDEGINHCLPNDTSENYIPCFKLGTSATKYFVAGTGLDIANFEKQSAKSFLPVSFLMKDKIVRFSVTLKSEPILVRNVLGLIPGKDPDRYVVIGAHYDHLGTHNGFIFNGSDDNASGTSGLLALAKAWVGSGVQPACNLLFASWTAEEEGLLGSEYFAKQLDKQLKNILLYINMDMISRSETSDSTQRKLSIGTRTSDENLRELGRKCNATLDHPFNLDLWDVTGHSGSDYASFTAKNIPVMTYNTGLHDDYHTPRDISAHADLVKMGDVLKLVNESLVVFLESIKK